MPAWAGGQNVRQTVVIVMPLGVLDYGCGAALLAGPVGQLPAIEKRTLVGGGVLDAP